MELKTRSNFATSLLLRAQLALVERAWCGGVVAEHHVAPHVDKCQLINYVFDSTNIHHPHAPHKRATAAVNFP